MKSRHLSGQLRWDCGVPCPKGMLLWVSRSVIVHMSVPLSRKFINRCSAFNCKDLKICTRELLFQLEQHFLSKTWEYLGEFSKFNSHRWPTHVGSSLLSSIKLFFFCNTHVQVIDSVMFWFNVCSFLWQFVLEYGNVPIHKWQWLKTCFLCGILTAPWNWWSARIKLHYLNPQQCIFHHPHHWITIFLTFALL